MPCLFIFYYFAIFLLNFFSFVFSYSSLPYCTTLTLSFFPHLGRKVEALRRCTFRELPPTLIIHLKRFEFNIETMDRKKVGGETSAIIQANIEQLTLFLSFFLSVPLSWFPSFLFYLSTIFFLSYFLSTTPHIFLSI